MRKASNEPTISDSARWLGMPIEEPTPHWWDDLLNPQLDGDVRVRLLAQLGYLARLGVKPDRPMLEEMIAEARERAERWGRVRADAPTEATVYYLRVGSMIKIGQTVRDLTLRLKAYPPDSVLLATEVGPANELEAERLWQFRADQAIGARRREWFRPSAALIDHINSLRDHPLTAAELAA